MSKEIVLAGWVSVVPNKMFNGWVKKKWIPKDAVYISCGEDDSFKSEDVLEKDEDMVDPKNPLIHWVSPLRKFSSSKSETKRLEAQGFKKKRKNYYVTEEAYEAIRDEVHAWYDLVFAYIDEWLIKNKFISLKKGSFGGGFCAVTNEDETTNSWGAPLANDDNKVVQIKEKFGQFRVYLTSCTEKDYKKAKKFQRDIEKKFDCQAYIG